MLKKTLFIGLSILLPVLLVVFIAEITLAYLRPQRVYRQLRELTGEQYSPGDQIPFVLKKSYSAKMPSMEHWGTYVSISTNSLGLRGPEIQRAKPLGIKRVLILGDSYTFGVFVGDEDVYPARLQMLLDPTQKKIEVLNAGYADGGDPDEHYAWLLGEGQSFQPDLVVYAFFSGNDINGIRDTRWRELDSLGLPRRIEDPDLYVDELGTRRSRKGGDYTVGAEVVYRYPVLRESHLAVYAFAKINHLFFRPKDQNKHGWGENSFGMLLKPRSEATPALLAKEERFKQLVLGMKHASLKMGARFAMVMIPANFEVDLRFLPIVTGNPDAKLHRNITQELAPFLKKNEIPYVDLLPLMRASQERLYPTNAEVHFNPAGHAFAARAIEPMVKKLLNE